MASSEAMRPLYGRLSSAEQQIRVATLLRGNWNDPIECRLQTISLRCEHKHHYNALSYVWKNSDNESNEIRNKVTILVDGEILLVSANLASALRHLRTHDRDQDLWADQICINQADEQEKEYQVPHLRIVYMYAGAVTLWMGEANRLSDRLANILTREELLPPTGQADAQDWTTFSQRLRELYVLILDLCKRRWWNRVWVVQECVLPLVEPVFRCGHRSFRFSDLYRGFDALNRNTRYLSRLRNSGNPELDSVLEHIASTGTSEADLLRPLESILQLRQEFQRDDQRVFPTIICFTLCVDRSAEVHHDYVYGFLGLLGKGDRDDAYLGYKNVAREHVFHNFIKLVLRSGAEKSHQAYLYSALREISFAGAVYGRPSWVPDLHNQKFSSRFNCTYLLPQRPPQTELHVKLHFDVQSDLMFLSGFRLGVITDVRRIPSERTELVPALVECRNGVRRILKTEKSLRSLFTCNSRPKLLADRLAVLDYWWDLWLDHGSNLVNIYKDSQHQRARALLGTVSVKDLITEFSSKAGLACGGRCLIMTKEKHVGIAVPNVQKQDIVIFPCGLIMPLILRWKRGLNHYIIVGGAYIDGLVTDFAVDQLVNGGNLTEEVFKIG